MDAVSRTKEMVSRGATQEEILGVLRDEGFSIIVSMSAFLWRAPLTSRAFPATVSLDLTAP
jgi:hypothetical protein